jgi:alpha-D-ribose 1-methylphosphonate 5-triphosphate synthase subunit PhnH
VNKLQEPILFLSGVLAAVMLSFNGNRLLWWLYISLHRDSIVTNENSFQMQSILSNYDKDKKFNFIEAANNM